ncbi:MAG: SAM-dependent chlorinase/fluorinase [Candidatus Omnitrophota bacterium]
MKKTNTIVLLTDFGKENNFVGVMKGVILGINPCVQMVDLTHGVGAHALEAAAFILWQSFSYFPHQTVFLAVVDPGVGSLRAPLAVQTRHYFFVGPDNGILSMAAQADGIKKIAVLQNGRYFLKHISSTFHGRDIFAPVAAYLSRGVPFSKIGKRVNSIKEIPFPLPVIKEDTLEGSIVYADTFGNLITNIKEDVFKKFLHGRTFVAYLKNKTIKKIYSCYAHAQMREPFFIVGSSLFLEISLKVASAKDYFSLGYIEQQTIIVKSRAA